MPQRAITLNSCNPITYTETPARVHNSHIGERRPPPLISDNFCHSGYRMDVFTTRPAREPASPVVITCYKMPNTELTLYTGLTHGVLRQVWRPNDRNRLHQKIPR